MLLLKPKRINYETAKIDFDIILFTGMFIFSKPYGAGGGTCFQ